MIKLSALHVYPIKSCGGISLPAAAIGEFGLALDRSWMLVDRAGRFLTQREHPLLATIKTSIEGDLLQVRAPAMPPLSLPLQALSTSARLPVTIWEHSMPALDG